MRFSPELTGSDPLRDVSRERISSAVTIDAGRFTECNAHLLDVAEQGAWEGIEQNGLLSTSALLDRSVCAAKNVIATNRGVGLNAS